MSKSHASSPALSCAGFIASVPARGAEAPAAARVPAHRDGVIGNGRRPKAVAVHHDLLRRRADA